MHLLGLALKLHFGQALYTSRCAYILCADNMRYMYTNNACRYQREGAKVLSEVVWWDVQKAEKKQTNFTSACHVWFYAFPLNNKDTQNNWTVLDLFPKFFTITLHCLVHVSRIVKLPIHFQNWECFTCLWACLNRSVNTRTNMCTF